MINCQLDYLIAQQHLAEARSSAERARMARTTHRGVFSGRRLRRVAACLAAAAAGVLALASPAWAAGRTLYVSSSASTDPSCAAASKSNPFATVTGALACAGNGSTIVLGQGTFAGGFTISHNVTVRGAGSGTVIANPGAPSLSLTEVTVAGGHTVTLEDLTVNGENETDVAAAGDSLTISHSLIENGVGTTGGDLVMTPGPGTTKLSILDSTISGGTGLGTSPGGLDIADAPQSSPSRTTIVNSTIADNQNGGIALGAWDALTIRDSTISGNVGAAGGSAGGGLAVVHGAPGVSPVTLTNTILAGNSAGEDPDCEDDQGITDGGHNVLGDQGSDCAGMTDGTNGDQVGTDSAPLNPELGPLADNGGSTPTMAPLAGSPAIGAGDPADCQAAPVSDADQRGHARNAPGRLACDVGAVDTGGVPLHTLYVSHGAGSDPACGAASKSHPFATLPGALSCASSGTLIRLGAGSFTAGVMVPGNVTLRGAGPQTVILGTGTDAETVPTITVPDDRFLTIKDLTVNGDASQAGLTMGTGAVNIIDSTVTNAFGPHGALAVLPPSGTAILNLLRSTVAGNDSSGVGGAVEAVDSEGADGSATINLTDSTVADNQGGQDGGGIYLDGRHTLNVRDSTIAGNQAADYGGGIYGWGTFAKVTLTDSIVAANGAGTGPDCYDPAGVTDGGHNVLGAGDANCTGLTDGVDGDHVGTDQSPLDPGLGALAGNGGPTQTMALQPGSPAIGAGSPADCKAAPVSDTDQRGDSRRAPSRGTCDIGAYDTGGATS